MSAKDNMQYGGGPCGEEDGSMIDKTTDPVLAVLERAGTEPWQREAGTRLYDGRGEWRVVCFGSETTDAVARAVNTFAQARDALRRLADAAALVNEIQHAGVKVPATAWADLYQKTNEARAALAAMDGKP